MDRSGRRIVYLKMSVFLSIFGQIGRMSKMKIKSFRLFVVFFWLIFFLTPLISEAQVVAGFTATPTAGCGPLNVAFTNTSTGGAASYSWDFGNGNTSTATNPSAIFSTPGVFTVTLTAPSGGSSTFSTTITVYSNPIASFTTSVMPSCPGELVTFTDNSTVGSGALSSWSWDFGDGNGQTSVTGIVTHAYASAGAFPVTMIVTDANGCTNSVIKPVAISAPPIAGFTASPISSCSPPLTVNFTNTSATTGTVTYDWNLGNGTTSALTNPSDTYNANGGYTVTLIVFQGACSDTLVKPNYIGIQNIVADFSVGNSSVCAGQSASFTDLSFPLSANQSWDFGDGSTSTATNPTHIYALPGTYNVRLIEGTAGCIDTVIKNNYITVNSSATVAFSANQTQSCSAPFAVTFSNTSTGGAFYSWDFGDGTPPFVTNSLANFTYTYPAAGSDSVTLTVTSGNGCVSVLTKPDYIVIADLVSDFTASPLEGCQPLLVNFTSTSTSNFDPIVSYSWNYGNGTDTTASPNTSNTYSSVGFFTVTLVVETSSGCRDTLTKINYVKAGNKPVANFSVVDSTVCYGTDAEFTDLSIGADSAYWMFDIAQGTFSTPSGAVLPFSPVTNLFPDTGTFFVTQIAYSYGCADTLKIVDIVTVLPPKPIFTFLLSCIDLYTVSFTDASEGADSIVWDFGDGSPIVSDVANPSHTFGSRGLKTVSLTAYNFLTGCASFITKTFTITEPIAQFTAIPTIGCYPLAVTFNSTSQDENSVLWTFGEGGPGLALNSPTFPFVYVYSIPNLDTAKLVITDINGCKDSTTTLITVYGPTPDFNGVPTAGCVPLPVTLTDASVSDSAIVQWIWDFGDGSPPQTVTTNSINHTYTTPGFYSVTMTVTDVNGCVKSLTKSNYIKPTFPNPAFVVDTLACRGEIVVFDASGTLAEGPATFDWNFGDGNTGTGVWPSHIYTSDNLYTVSLTVTDVNGCDSTIQHQIRIQHPTATFSDSVLLIGCGVTNMQFTDLSTGLYLSGWQWSFGDGASSAQQNPMHAYTVPGTYTVSLITTNNGGCTDTIATSVIVPGPSGTFSFTPSTGCPPLTVTFTAVSSTAISYTWDFGDGTVVTTANPVIQYTYNTDIVATPALLVGSTLPDGSFCQVPAPFAGVITVVTVIPTVVTSANVTSGCIPLTVNFIDNSIVPNTIPGDTITSWNWNFGDGTSSTLQNPSHVFPAAGTYPVTLSISTLGGCASDNSDSALIITVYPDPIAAFSVNSTDFDLPYDATICTNQSVGAATYSWNLGDGTTTTTENPQHLYTSVGTFQIQLIAVSQFGCPDTAFTTINTHADVIFPNAFSPNPGSGSGGDYTLFSTNNDVFFPYTEGVVNFSFEIFNRWGEKIFESFDINKGWDGYYKGKLCEQGVYVWRAYVRLNDGKEFNKNGDVTLLR